MKRVFISIFFIISFISGFAQSQTADSLKVVLANANKPMEQFDALNKLVLELVGWKGDNVDSAFCTQMLQIAQQLKNDSLLAISYNWLGSYFYLNKGDNATALEYFYKALPYAQKHDDKRRISSLYFDIALVHFDLQNLDEALQVTKKGGQNLPDMSHPLYGFMLLQYLSNMADYFIRMNQVDSVFYFARQMASTVEMVERGSAYGTSVLVINGAANALAGNLSQADENFRKALSEVDTIPSTTIKILFYAYYIPYLINTDRIDEAEQQSRNLLNLGMTYKNNNLKLAGAGFLRKVFEVKRKIDSAYYYSQKEANINAEIFSENNRNRIQSLAFSDQLRAMEEKAKEEAYRNQLKLYGLLTGLSVFFIIAFILFRNNRQKQKANKILEATLTNLKSTQSQLIQSEKMASLGELTAGIAHEIQNPLNFVNNFSEVNEELLTEMKDELDKGNIADAKTIANDAIENQQKILHHGKRADAIVKGMLQHSRSSSGVKEPTDINALADEYLRLAYHGLRAKDKSFNAKFETDFDASLPKINVVPQDIGRVILNLITNAFYVVNEKKKQQPDGYEPTVSVSTHFSLSSGEGRGEAIITVKDNGNGIPETIKEKIFQPFFTTKPTGQGTGLGLSMSYDIVTKAHKGEIKVETEEGKGTEFIVVLPMA